MLNKIAAQIAGINPKNFRAISTSKATNFGLSPSSLQSTILADIESGLVPLFLLDPIGPLCEVAKMYGIWVHVDAAYAGSACICPEFRHFIDDSSSLVKAQSTNPEYLKNKATESKQVIDYKDWQVALRLIDMDNRFEIVVPRTFAMVCFRLKPTAVFKQAIFENDYIETQTNEVNAKLLESVNASGKIYMTHAVVGGVYMIRFAVGATLTEERHVTGAWKVVQEHTDAILGELDGTIVD
ncbi:hypothetical protein MKW94_025860 [Papaver nudicaule]|uniref:tyrosine decarboxylase n=1 Tax=Papaver nudicaule TaxID=74823 RepID=A0AA42B0W9_PAPNU|nr:hypothetical protein [Papaver nudicaule]